MLHHETRTGWSTAETAGRLKQLATEYCVSAVDFGAECGSEFEFHNLSPDMRRVLYAPGSRHPDASTRTEIHVDDDGVGGGVVDQGDGFHFLAISGAEKAIVSNGYPNRRSEMWFDVAQRASEGRLDLSRLSEESRELLRRQVMAPSWKLDGAGRRVVEAKSDTKRRIGRSPDDADALNLAFAVVARLVVDQEMHARFWAAYEREDD